MTRLRANAPTRIAGLLAGGVLLLAACSASGATTAPSTAPSAAPSTGLSAAPSAAASGQAVQVTVAQDAKLGAILVGPSGMTLYVFKKDSGGKSACTGQCATSWPPLTVTAGGNATGGTGVTGPLATIARDDGTTQVTYNGVPLYYFGGDKKAGDTNGQGLNGLWFAATPSGTSGTITAAAGTYSQGDYAP